MGGRMWGRCAWIVGCGVGVSLGGCTPNTTGIGSGTAASVGQGPGDSDDGTTSTTGAGEVDDPGTGDGGSVSTGGTFGVPDDTGPDPSTTDATTGEPVTTSEGGAPLIVITDGGTYDFGPIATGSSSGHLFTVSNQGDGEATGLSGAALAAPFAFTGAFPGAMGTCTGTLPPGSSCTVEVRFAPGELGLHAATLAIAHDQGPDVTCDLVGGGTGQSANLIVNGGGENDGTPPPSWTNAGAGNWMAGAWAEATYPDPTQGSGYITGLGGPNDADYVLRQDVPVAQWASSIDAGVIRLAFQGQARSYQRDNDSHRIRVEYRSDAGAVLATYDTNWLGTPSWQLRADDRLAPVGTRTVRVELMCRKTAFEYCDAYYDELQLRASYP